MILHQLKPILGSNQKKKRIGRGNGSRGNTSGRGNHGQLARSGGRTRPVFEGGQTPFFQRIPKRGFVSLNKKKVTILNLFQLNIFNNNDLVNLETLKQKKLIRKITSKTFIKILGEGKLHKKLTIQAHSFSKKAKDEVARLKGNVEVIK